MKLHKWRKGVVEWDDGEAIHLSVVFTWDTDEAYRRALFYRAAGRRVRIGGPGVFVGSKDLREIAEVGGDSPDAVARHNPHATFASRGCPVGCWFCIVPAMEGREFSLFPDFEPRPILCDNNLSALPADYQDHIIARYRGAGRQVWDANSGFEPATFTEDVYRRWEEINRGPWRFAFDEEAEREDVRRVLVMLGAVSRPKKRVYVLIGNEPVDQCMDRILSVVGWGGDPHAQPVMKLNARRKRPWVRHDWTADLLRDVARWTNRHLWRYTDFAGYRTGVRSRTHANPLQRELA